MTAEMAFSFPPELVARLRGAQSTTVLTGSGVSAESGVPTFREAQTGLWSRYRPEELATPQAFRDHPALVWEWYTWRRGLVAKADPNPAHVALAEMELRLPGFTLITQNVDGLHQRAGSGRRCDVIELHGNIQRAKCFEHGHLVEAWQDEGEIPPHCPHCDGLLRPDVVWFGEALPDKALKTAWEAAQDCQVFFSIGTSGLVEPAASLPYLALEKGATVVEINPNETPLTRQTTYVLRGPAGEVLPALVAAVWPTEKDGTRINTD
jgi:NAD-dependent deacetylase